MPPPCARLHLIAFLMAIALPAAAQDTIFTRGGRQIPATVVQIQGHRVHYRLPEAGDSTQHWHDLHFVRSIYFADGRSWPPSPEEALRIKLARRDRMNRKNNFSFAFIGIQVLGDYVGPTLGVGYERFIDPERRWSLGLPVSAFAMEEGGFGLDRYPVSFTQHAGFYASPDVQYHLFRRKRRVAISTGLAVPLGVIRRRDNFYDMRGEYLGTNKRQYVLASTEAVLALRIVSTRSLAFMARMSGGPVISHNAVYGGTFRAAFCMGFRY